MKRAILLGLLSLLLCLLIAVSARAGWTEPVPVQELNMSGDEFSPYLSANGQVMIFDAQGTVTMSHWNGTSWGPREYLPSPINYIGLQRQAAITPDLNWIYWISWRAGGLGMWDIWRASWDDSGHTCGPAECLGPNVNSGDIEWNICFTSSGQRMYFVTDTREKNGQYSVGYSDIWYVDWDSSYGDWGEPFNLGPPVNTIDLEEYPYISLDDSILYFSCPGAHWVPGWQGGYDIYKAISHGSNWELVENLLSPVNSATTDFGPSISPNGLQLYFCTFRNRVPDTDYELMVSTWDPSGVEDEIEPNENSIELDLYPNPFNDAIAIRLTTYNEKSAHIYILDIKGQKVKEYEISLNNGAGTTTWDGFNQQRQKVATGNYILKIIFPDGKEIRRVITLVK